MHVCIYKCMRTLSDQLQLGLHCDCSHSQPATQHSGSSILWLDNLPNNLGCLHLDITLTSWPAIALYILNACALTHICSIHSQWCQSILLSNASASYGSSKVNAVLVWCNNTIILVVERLRTTASERKMKKCKVSSSSWIEGKFTTQATNSFKTPIQVYPILICNL